MNENSDQVEAQVERSKENVETEEGDIDNVTPVHDSNKVREKSMPTAQPYARDALNIALYVPARLSLSVFIVRMIW